MAGTASGGDFRVNIGQRQTGRAIGSGGVLQRGLRLERPDAAQKQARGFYRGCRNAQEHGDWLAFGRDDQIIFRPKAQAPKGRYDGSRWSKLGAPTLYSTSLAANRLIRPLFHYTGPAERRVAPLTERGCETS